MKINNIIMGMVGIMICAVMIGGAFLPAISSAVDGERVILNNVIGNSNFSVIKNPSADETHVITWEVGSDKQIVDGVVAFVAPYNSYMIYSDKIAVNISRSGSIGYWTVDHTSGNFAEDVTNISVNVTGTSIRLTTNGAAPVDVTVSGISWYALPDNEGIYKLAQSPNSDTGAKYYLNSIDQIYGLMNVNTNSLGLVAFSGKDAVLPDNTIVSMKSNSVKDDRYTDVIEISAYKGYYLDPEYLVNIDQTVISPYYMLIPTKIIAHTPQQASINAMFNILPIIAIAGVVMAGIYVFISRK